MSKTGKYRFSAEDEGFESVDFGAGSGKENQTGLGEIRETVDLGDDAGSTKTSSKEDVLKKLAKLAGVKLSRKEIEALTVVLHTSSPVTEKLLPGQQVAEKIGEKIGKKFSDPSFGQMITAFLTNTLKEDANNQQVEKCGKAIDNLILAKKLEKEADQSLTKLYKGAGKTSESGTLKDYLNDKYSKRTSRYPADYVNAAGEAEEKAKEAKSMASRLLAEAKRPFDSAKDFTGFSVDHSQAAALLKGKDSVKAATHNARKQYLKAFWPVQYKLGQIASSLSPFRLVRNSKGSSSTPSETRVSGRQDPPKGMGK